MPNRRTLVPFDAVSVFAIRSHHANGTKIRVVVVQAVVQLVLCGADDGLQICRNSRRYESGEGLQRHLKTQPKASTPLFLRLSTYL